MKRTAYYIALALAAITVMPLLFFGMKGGGLPSRTFNVMGTFLTIKADTDADIDAAYKKVKELEGLMSRFDKKSELSRINAAMTGTEIIVSPDTFGCIELAKKVSAITGGAFDITLSGEYRSIALNAKKSSVTLKKPGMKLDLDGIAKGYAVEAARSLLFKRGVKSGIIDMRSSIAVLSGPKTIGIRDPFNKDKMIGTIVLNTGEALSTSGSYEQGKHIIDQRTGAQADEVVGVTIVGRDAGLLDGLSTGLFVLGTKEGMAAAKRLDMPVIFIRKDGQVFKYKL